jgi:copper chaperone CopZ
MGKSFTDLLFKKCAVCGKLVNRNTCTLGMSIKGSFEEEYSDFIYPKRGKKKCLFNYKYIEECPYCGYCNTDIEKKLKKVDVVYTNEYKNQDDEEIKYSMLLKENGFYIKAMKYLFVAYYCVSTYVRGEKKPKTNIVNLILNNYQFLEENLNRQKLYFIKLVITDILRREKKFDLALKFIEDKFPKKYQKIVDFEKKLIEFEDNDEYCLDDIDLYMNKS